MLNKRQLHFEVEVNGINIVYAYIRKNGCSSWKRFFAGVSPYKEEAKGYDNLIGFMGKYHKIRKKEKIDRNSNNIVVLREPLERFYSGFINQFLMRVDRPSSLHGSVNDFFEKSFSEVTLEDFVFSYLQQKNDEIDAHFWSQSSHMAEVEYHHKWLIQNLFSEASGLFGEDVAKEYFLKRANSTNEISRNDYFSSKASVGEMFEVYMKESSLPSMDSLLNESIRDEIYSMYSDDFDLYQRVKDGE